MVTRIADQHPAGPSGRAEEVALVAGAVEPVKLAASSILAYRPGATVRTLPRYAVMASARTRRNSACRKYAWTSVAPSLVGTAPTHWPVASYSSKWSLTPAQYV